MSGVAHYEAMVPVFVDEPHPGQGRDFDDEAPVTLPEKKGKGRNHTFRQLTYVHLCPLVEYVSGRGYSLMYIGHVVAIKPECFALICGQCLEKLSDKKTMRPLHTCKEKGHIKVQYMHNYRVMYAVNVNKLWWKYFCYICGHSYTPKIVLEIQHKIIACGLQPVRRDNLLDGKGPFS